MFENAFDFVPAQTLMAGDGGGRDLARIDQDDFASDSLNFGGGFLGRCATVRDDARAAIAQTDGDASLGSGVEGVGVDAASEGLGFLAKFRVDSTEAVVGEKDASAFRRVIQTPAHGPIREANDWFATLKFAGADPALPQDTLAFFARDFDQVLSAATGATMAGPVLNNRQI